MQRKVGVLALLGLALAAMASLSGAHGPRATAAGCSWMDTRLSADARATRLIAAMTLDEKLSLVHGSQPQTYFQFTDPHSPNGGAAGIVPAIPRLCMPAIVLNDGGAGIGDQQNLVTAFPDGIAQASTWDPALTQRLGAALGREAFAKGVNVLLAPGVNIPRTPLGSRSFEYAGEDPYLAGRAAAAVVRGVQSQHVIATVKHFAANDQETNRTTVSSDLDERTLMEMQTPAFEAAIDAGAGAVMCSYNKVNSVWACENPTLLTTVLRQRLGFTGWVMSDWQATHSTTAAARAGLDQEMPAGVYFGATLKAAVQAGTVPVSRIDAMVRHIVTPMFRVGLFDHVPTEGAAAAAANASTAASLSVAQQVAEEGSVLLKDSGSILPLAGGKRIALIGDAANPAGAELAYHGYGSGHVPEFTYQAGVVSPLQAITRRAASSGDVVTYADGSEPAAAIATAAAADIAVVVVNDVTVEGADRPDLKPREGTCNVIAAACAYSPVDQDALVASVAKANPHTVVVLQTGGPVLMPWLPDVQGVLEQWLPGQVDGDALAAVLFGDAAPTGRLPMTFPAKATDGPIRSAAQYPGINLHAAYSERLEVGYRWYDAHHVAPLFPFGFGLTYTSFRLSGLHASASGVSVAVSNTGTRDGDEVVEVYAALPTAAGEPPHRLVGFARVHVLRGRTVTVEIPLDAKAFQIWDVAGHRWVTVPGSATLLVGTSSRDLPLRSPITIR